VKKSEPRILSGFLQDIGYTNIGLESNTSTEFIERFLLMNSTVMQNAPMHIAVHFIKNIDTPPDPYAQIHCHPDADEIGLIIAPKDELEYEIVLDGETNRVKSPAAVYIPSGTYHRARAVSGSGAYVCIILDPRGPLADNITVAG
jgi:mannose-6-phosphate isomerase-like protein (cupin superfamily)